VNKIKVCSAPEQSGDNWLTSIKIWSATKNFTAGKETTNCKEYPLTSGDCFTEIKVYFDRQVEYLSAKTKNG
jgi:hypothetical protein